MIMNTQLKNLWVILLGVNLAMAGASVYAARTLVNTTQYGTTPTSSVFNPTTPTPRTQCPKLTIFRTALDSRTQAITLASVNTNRQTPDPYGGYMLYVMGSGGGTLSAACTDPNYPYLCGFDERWIMVTGSGGPRLYYRCCPPPQPTMRMEYGNSEWTTGTDCN